MHSEVTIGHYRHGIAALAGCASAPPEPEEAPIANIAVEEDIGFQITEEIAIEESVRMQYDDALRLLEQGLVDQGIAGRDLQINLVKIGFDHARQLEGDAGQ